MSMTPQPIKNLDALLKQPPNHPVKNTAETGLAFNPFIYGNDIDSVDIATRVAMVSFMWCNVSHYTRVSK